MNTPLNSGHASVSSIPLSHETLKGDHSSVRFELDKDRTVKRPLRAATTRTGLEKFNTRTDDLTWEATLLDTPLHRMHALLEVRFQRIADAVVIRSRTAITDDPLDYEAAAQHAAKRVQIELNCNLEWIAVYRGPDSLGESQRRVRDLAALLDAFERSSCEGLIARRSGPSWLDYRAACEDELSKFRLWALSVEGAARKRESDGVSPCRPLTRAEQRIWDVLGAAGKTSAQIAREAGFSSPDTVRGHLGRMKGKVPVAKDQSGRYIRGVGETSPSDTPS